MATTSSPVGECTRCEYPEVLIGDDQPTDGVLKPGMRVLIPCHHCGAPPVEELEWATSALDATQAALDKLMVDRDMLLFHWAPRARRKQITRYGLRPSMRATTHAGDGWKAPYICFADDPRWAWLLSGAQRSAPAGEWDLWQTRAAWVTEPQIMPGDVSNGIHEVRTQHRVFKRSLKLIGSRTK